MTDLRTAAQQALEALEEYQSKGVPFLACDGAVDALRAALAQQDEPKPMSPEQRQRWKELAAMPQQAEPLNLADPAVQKRLATQWGYVPAAQAEPVQPVAWRYKPMIGSSWSLSDDGYYISCKRDKGYIVDSLYTAPPQRKPLTEKEMYIVEEEARKNFRLAQAGPRGQMITYWDSLTPWLIRAVERAHGIKE